MRKLASIAGAALLAVTAFASPASAQSASIGGSCGEAAGQAGLTDIHSANVNEYTATVPALFYTFDYSGIPAPTTIGVIVRYNGELESQTTVVSTAAEEAGGTFNGALRSASGLTPGEYVFHVYTGSLADVYNVKDGTVAHNAFVADEKGYLGSFSCGVSTNQGTGPG